VRHMHGPYLNCGNNDSQAGYLILLDLELILVDDLRVGGKHKVLAHK
jgi:hypothetical protein